MIELSTSSQSLLSLGTACTNLGLFGICLSVTEREGKMLTDSLGLVLSAGGAQILVCRQLVISSTSFKKS